MAGLTAVMRPVNLRSGYASDVRDDLQTGPDARRLRCQEHAVAASPDRSLQDPGDRGRRRHVLPTATGRSLHKAVKRGAHDDVGHGLAGERQASALLLDLSLGRRHRRGAGGRFGSRSLATVFETSPVSTECDSTSRVRLRQRIPLFRLTQRRVRPAERRLPPLGGAIPSRLAAAGR